MNSDNSQEVERQQLEDKYLLNVSRVHEPMTKDAVYDRMLELGGTPNQTKPNTRRIPTIKLPLLQPPNPKNYKLPKPMSYNYQPLPTDTSIRLLKLLPPEDQVETQADYFQPLHCTMEVVDLADEPVYDALSYTWGDPLTLYSSASEASPPESWAARVFPIMCDGQAVTVTTNLYTALIALRLMATREIDDDLAAMLKRANLGRTNRLWIDAICIDQANLEERNKQILLMGRIYSSALYVRIWLGAEEPKTSRALAILHELANVPLPTARGLKLLNIWDEDTCEKAGFSPITINEWIDLWAFLNRSWFKRAWVVQEGAMAKRPVLICGMKMIEFRAPVQALAVLRISGWIHQLRMLAEPCITGQVSKHISKERIAPVPAEVELYQPQAGNTFNHNLLLQMVNASRGLGIEDKTFKRREGARAEPLRTILNKYRSSEATDPRDKVYSFLGISREFVENCHPEGVELVPNYNQSTREVYLQTAKYIIASSGRLELLSLVEDSHVRKEDLPSWVPDFSAECFPTPMDDGRPTPWSASAGLAQVHISYPSDDLLELRGVMVATVVESARISTNEINALKMVQKLPEMSEIKNPVMNERVEDYMRHGEIEEWGPERQLPENPPNTSGNIKKQSRFEVFWRTAMTDCFRGQHPAPAELEDGFKASLLNDIRRQELRAIREYLDGDPVAWQVQRTMATLLNVEIQKLLGTAQNGDEYMLPAGFQRFVDALDDAGAGGEDYTTRTRRAFMEFLEQNEVAGRRDVVRIDVENRLAALQGMRQLFLTDDGRLGSGPMAMEPGDQVWILAGAFMPFVLRPVGGGRFRLVGEAYVHGIMHGEAVLEKGSIERHLKTIVLE